LEEAATTPAPTCFACGRPHAVGQEYCLECGTRIERPLGLRGSLGAAWRRRLGWYPGDWIWPSLVALAVAAAGGAVAIAASAAETSSGPRTIVATQALIPWTPPRSSTPARRSRAGPGPGPGKTSAGRLISWPGGDRYTIVLTSLPLRAGPTAVKARAEEATRAGLHDVGILVSSSYSSLHPGYYIVFSGVYNSIEEAQGALPAARPRFPAAFASQVAQ
jgi:hypothetical protein